jgi:hypothetical protein
MAPTAGHEAAYECGNCGGTLERSSLFERRLSEGVGALAWKEAARGDPVGPCPYCLRSMRGAERAAVGPQGLIVCVLDQQVWYPPTALDWLKRHALADEERPVRVALPDRCRNCGAAFAVDHHGRCPRCHEPVDRLVLAGLSWAKGVWIATRPEHYDGGSARP